MRFKIIQALALTAALSGAVTAEGGDYFPNGTPDELRQAAERFEHGESVPQHFQRAYGLYCLAALRGDARSAFGLGWMYANGRGVPSNEGLAAGWFAHAATLGDAFAGATLRRLGSPALLEDEQCRVRGSDWIRHRARITAIIYVLAPDFGLDPSLVTAVVRAESGFDPRAESAKGARGLMQLMPATARRFGVENRWDVVQNLSGGMAYLNWLMNRFDGDLSLVLAAYNAGEDVVSRQRGIPPYPETRGYVRGILSAYGQVRSPARIGLDLGPALFTPPEVSEALQRFLTSAWNPCCGK
jgi:hypothetical protein